MLGDRWRDRLTRRNTAEQRALDANARRMEAEAAWRAELAGLGDRIVRAIIADDTFAPEFAGISRGEAARAATAIVRRVVREACVILPDHSITAAPDPAAGRHRSQADQA
jgi:hypothetical protein